MFIQTSPWKKFSLLLLLLLSLLLLACQREPEIVPLIDPLAFPQQAMQRVECTVEVPAGETVTCGALSVPADYDDFDSAQVELRLTIYESLSEDPEPDPVIMVGGGFGGFGGFGGGGTNRTIDLFQESRDVIRFNRVDPAQASDEDEELQCPEISTVYFDSLQQTQTRAALEEQTLAAYKTCRERYLTAGTPIIGGSVEQTANDILTIRQSLGIEKFDLVVTNYNTQVALQLMQLQPDALRSVIISGFYPPVAAADQQASLALALQGLFAACADDAACSEAYPRLESKFVEVLNQLEVEPLALEVKHPVDPNNIIVQVDGEELVLLLRDLLSFRDGLEGIPMLIELIHSGEGYKLAAELQELLVFRSFQQQGVARISACSDRWAANSILINDAASQYPLIQQTLQADYDLLAQVCALWFDQPFEPPQVQAVSSNLPVLVLHGALNPNFSPELVEAWLKGFRNAQVVVFPGYGSSILMSADCSATVVAGFLENPTRRVDSACVEREALEFIVPQY
jgi:pimeloyl-ACP methyl ester carboxylesterase